jgi:hypothetical protein
MFFLLCISGNLISQTQPPIEGIVVNYKSDGILLPDSANPSAIKVLPEAIITLTTTSNVSKIYFKMIRLSDSSILYDVNYTINSSPITNSENIILFSRDNNIISLNNPNNVLLDTYSYEIRTEDSQGNLSSIFSEIH